MRAFLKSLAAVLFVLLCSGAAVTYKHTHSFQLGNSGLAMEVLNSEQQMAERVALNQVPVALPPITGGQLAVDAYKNVHVLGHISSGDFTRLMASMTAWVAPNNGCGYCHAPAHDASGAIVKDANGQPLADPNNMQSDELYTKVVARRMLQMTMRVNGDWKQHVGQTGVTCYTCHRGYPVPQHIWFDEPLGATRYQGMPNPPRFAPAVFGGMTSLPVGTLRPFFAGDAEIRVQAWNTIQDDRTSIKQTEWTYSLMTHLSESLGVNCTYCHNTRAFGDWAQSPPARTTAWHGIRMVRELNGQFLEPLASTFPQQRLGPLGDGPKLNCATCHQGAYKPLLGVSMLKDYPVLAEAKPQPSKSAPAAPAAQKPAADAAAAAAGLNQEGAPATQTGETEPGASPASPPTGTPESSPVTPTEKAAPANPQQQ